MTHEGFTGRGRTATAAIAVAVAIAGWMTAVDAAPLATGEKAGTAAAAVRLKARAAVAAGAGSTVVGPRLDFTVVGSTTRL